MIITKDMLIAKGISQQIVNEFSYYYPNDLNTDNTYSKFDLSLELVIARLFSLTCLRTFTGSDIHQVNFINGKINNLPNGDPGFVIFDTQAQKPREVAYYKNNHIHNPAMFKPAIIAYHSNGVLAERVFAEMGQFNDPSPAIPAYARYDVNGKMEQIIHYRHGLMTKGIIL